MGSKITIEVYPGCAIERACEDACRVANRLGIDVEFSFNGVTCLACPDGSSAELASNWDHQLRRPVRGPYDRRFAMTNSKSAGEFLRANRQQGQTMPDISMCDAQCPVSVSCYRHMNSGAKPGYRQSWVAFEPTGPKGCDSYMPKRGKDRQ